MLGIPVFTGRILLVFFRMEGRSKGIRQSVSNRLFFSFGKFFNLKKKGHDARSEGLPDLVQKTKWGKIVQWFDS